MRKKIKFLLLSSIIVLFFFTFLSADELKQHSKQDILSFWSNLRLRYEFQDNFNLKSYGENAVVGKNNDSFVLGRLRAGFKYNSFERLEISVGVQDSRAWDLALDEKNFYKVSLGRQNNPYEDRWEPFNTYILFKNFFSLPLSLKAGRQLIYYGDKRIFGPGMWGNSGRWIWDAVKTSYKFNFGFIDAFYGKTMIHDPDKCSIEHKHNFESIGVYSHFDLPVDSKIAIESFAMTKKSNGNELKGEDGKFSEIDSYYLGIRAFGKNIYNFDWDATFIQQFGDYANDNIEAYGYHLLLTYNFNETPFKPRLSIEYSFGSGDGDSTDGDNETFDGAFGARDKMYGRMNLFYWQNIKNAQINLEFNPKKWLYVKAGYHQFWLADEKDAWYLNSETFRDKTGQSGIRIGDEVDLVFILDLPRDIQIQFGAGHFFPKEFAENVASDYDATLVFVQWQWKFQSSL